VGENAPFFKSSFAIYLLNYFTGLQLYNQIYSAAKILFKETCKFICVLRNSCNYVEKWKGEYRGEERRGERRENESRNTALSFIKLLYLPT
jgi:hypothetical protein